MKRTDLKPFYINSKDGSRTDVIKFGKNDRVVFLSRESAEDFFKDYSSILSESQGTYDVHLHLFCKDNHPKTLEALKVLSDIGNPITLYMGYDDPELMFAGAETQVEHRVFAENTPCPLVPGLVIVGYGPNLTGETFFDLCFGEKQVASIQPCEPPRYRKRQPREDGAIPFL